MWTSQPPNSGFLALHLDHFSLPLSNWICSLCWHLILNFLWVGRTSVSEAVTHASETWAVEETETSVWWIKSLFLPSSSLSERWLEWYWVGVSMTKIKELSHFTFGLVEIAFPPLGGGTSWVMLADTDGTVRKDLSVLKTEFSYRYECCNTLFTLQRF